MTRLCRYWPVWWTNSPPTLQLDPSLGVAPGMTSVRADPHTPVPGGEAWDGRGRCGHSQEYWWSGSAIDIVDWYCQIQSRHLMFIGKNPCIPWLSSCRPSSHPTVGLMPFSFTNLLPLANQLINIETCYSPVLHSYNLTLYPLALHWDTGHWGAKSSYFIHLIHLLSCFIVLKSLMTSNSALSLVGEERLS